MARLGVSVATKSFFWRVDTMHSSSLPPWTVRLTVFAWSVSWLAGLPAGEVAGRLEPAHLLCEYQKEPLAIDVETPQFSWMDKARDPADRGLRQTAYRLLVASNPELLQQERGDLWDTGEVRSDQSLRIRYAGSPLESRHRYFWQVKLWDQDGRASTWSEAAQFTLGLLQPEAWTARWITAGTAELPVFRHEFVVAQPIRRALVRVCGLGHYELHLNGQASATRCSIPAGPTTASVPLHHLRRDRSTCSGPQCAGRDARQRHVQRDRRPVRQVPRIVRPAEADPATATSSMPTAPDRRRLGRSWKTAPGPIRFSCIYGGEDYDARRESPGWDRPGSTTRPGGRQPSSTVPAAACVRSRRRRSRSCRSSRPVTRHGARSPACSSTTWARTSPAGPGSRFAGPAGATVKLIPGELLDARGPGHQRSSGGPVWFSYTLRRRRARNLAAALLLLRLPLLQVEGRRAGRPGRRAAGSTPGR